MKPDRPLIFLLLLIIFFAVFPPILHFLNQAPPEYTAEGMPADVLHNYFLAVHNRAYELAYSYLAEDENKPDLSQFKQSFKSNPIGQSGVGIEIGETQMNAGEASVSITLIYLHNRFPGEFRREQQNASLVFINDSWKIITGPYPYWFWDWYGPPVKPMVPPVPARE